MFLFTWLRKRGGRRGVRPHSSSIWARCCSHAWPSGSAVGYFADRWIGTSPWLLLIGLALGIVAAGVNFYRTIKTLNESNRDDR